MERRLAAILVADVVGTHAVDAGMLAALKELRETLVDAKFAAHQGRIVRLLGDGMLVEFPDVLDAVRAAMELQQAVAERRSGLLDDGRIEYRIGVNLGAVEVDGDRAYGDAVVVAARVEELAGPGAKCISESVHEQVQDRLSVTFEDLGEKAFQNIDRPVRVWQWMPAVSGDTGSAAADLTFLMKAMSLNPGRGLARKKRWNRRRTAERLDDILLRDPVKPGANPGADNIASLRESDAGSQPKNRDRKPEENRGKLDILPPREGGKEAPREPQAKKISQALVPAVFLAVVRADRIAWGLVLSN